MRGKGFGIASDPTPIGYDISLSVPSGPKRSIDVYGLDTLGSSCFGAADVLGYFLGGIVDDVFQSKEVTVPISFSSSAEPDVICGFSGPAEVLGQPDLLTNTPATTAEGMTGPYDVKTDGSRVVVADTSNSRVLIWNSLPTVDGEPADFALGQPDLTSGVENAGAGSGSASAIGFDHPRAVALFDDSLLVSDTQNNRVLIWNSFPTAWNDPPDVVVGQPDFTSSGTGSPAAANNLFQPRGLAVSSSGALYIADEFNNRVLFFSSVPSTNGENATYAMGQADLTSSVSSISQGILNQPRDVSVEGGLVAVADGQNHRIMVFNEPTADGQLATLVLGQPDFTTGTPNCSSSGMNGPNGVVLLNDDLYVSDTSNHRLLYWGALSSQLDGNPAESLSGQPDFTTCSPSLGPDSFDTPVGISVDQLGYTWVADSQNSRVRALLFP